MVSISGNTTTCPRCGATCRVMEGVFDFDAAGFATAISAPAWSREALAAVQGKVKALERMVANESIADAIVDRWIDKTVEEIRELGPDGQAAVIASAVAARAKVKPRHRARKALAALVVVMGAIVTIKDGGDVAAGIVEDLIAWVDAHPGQEPPLPLPPSDGP